MKTAIKRGDIVLVRLDGAEGAEKHSDDCENGRPCLVVQNDRGNEASPMTIIAPITDAEQGARLPTQVLLQGADRGPLDIDSIVELQQVRTVDNEARITRNIGSLSEKVMKSIDRALKKSLGLN